LDRLRDAPAGAVLELLFDIVDRNCGRYVDGSFRDARLAAGCGVDRSALSGWVGALRCVVRVLRCPKLFMADRMRRSAELPELGAFGVVQVLRVPRGRCGAWDAREGFGFGSSAKKGIW
jgi:hypothetical protein